MGLGFAQMVLDILISFKPTQFYMLNNICCSNFTQNSSPGVFLAPGLLLAVYGPGIGPDGPGCPENMYTNPVLYAEQHLFQQLCPEIKPWGVLALGLLLAVYGPGLGPDGPGCPEKL